MAFVALVDAIFIIPIFVIEFIVVIIAISAISPTMPPTGIQSIISFIVSVSIGGATVGAPRVGYFSSYFSPPSEEGIIVIIFFIFFFIVFTMLRLSVVVIAAILIRLLGFFLVVVCVAIRIVVAITIDTSSFPLMALLPGTFVRPTSFRRRYEVVAVVDVINTILVVRAAAAVHFCKTGKARSGNIAIRVKIMIVKVTVGILVVTANI